MNVANLFLVTRLSRGQDKRVEQFFLNLALTVIVRLLRIFLVIVNNRDKISNKFYAQ